MILLHSVFDKNGKIHKQSYQMVMTFYKLGRTNDPSQKTCTTVLLLTQHPKNAGFPVSANSNPNHKHISRHCRL